MAFLFAVRGVLPANCTADAARRMRINVANSAVMRYDDSIRRETFFAGRALFAESRLLRPLSRMIF